MRRAGGRRGLDCSPASRCARRNRIRGYPRDRGLVLIRQTGATSSELYLDTKFRLRPATGRQHLLFGVECAGKLVMRDVQQSRRSDRTFRKPFEWLTSDQQHQLLWAARHCRTDPYREVRKSRRDQRSRLYPGCSRCCKISLRKMQRLGRRKAIQNQLLTSSVLNPRSREVWRQTGRETEFRVLASCRSAEVFARSPWLLGFQRAEIPRRKLVAERLAEGEELDLTLSGLGQGGMCPNRYGCWRE